MNKIICVLVAMALSFPSQASELKVVVHEIQFPEGPQYQKLLEAIDGLERVLNSPAFKQKVLGYKGRDGKSGFSGNKGLNNAQIYAVIMRGRELLLPESEGDMDLQVREYQKRFSKVIAYTEPTKHMWINVNWKFYRSLSMPEMAGNLTHEWIHLLGFTHSSARDWDSVPYAVGDMVEESLALAEF